MALWRIGGGWSEAALRRYLDDLEHRSVNFDLPPSEMTKANGWTIDGADELIGTEPPGPPVPDGLFLRAKQALINYDFSDPSIVVGHFDPRAPLVGRNMLLELKVLGLRFLTGVRVHSVRDETDERRSTFGFRYDTLEGHVERGFEWFVVSKDHETGHVRHRIEAHWRLAEFPNWWSRLGFLLIGERYREAWRRKAAARLRRLAHQPAEKPVTDQGTLAHRGDDRPTRTQPRS